jgi:enamine deaminase RidA (YjgF/YER057c/UK114 family)
VSLDPQGNVVGKGDLRAQARQVYDNLRVALAAAGAAPKDVVKTTTFVVNYKPDALPILREVRGAFYGEGAIPPASTLLGVQALARRRLPDRDRGGGGSSVTERSRRPLSGSV